MIDSKLLQQVKTAILPDAECLSDEEIELLISWVNTGGRLFFTAGTATHDENRRRRPRHGILQRISDFPAQEHGLSPAQEWHHWLRNDFTEFETSDSVLPGWKPVIHPYGKGLMGLWPQIDSGAPESQQDFADLKAFLFDLHGPMNVEIHGPPSLLVEFNHQPATSETLIHLIRTDAGDDDISITIRNGMGWKECRVLSPDQQPPATQIKGKILRLSRLSRYAIVAFPSSHDC